MPTVKEAVQEGLAKGISPEEMVSRMASFGITRDDLDSEWDDAYQKGQERLGTAGVEMLGFEATQQMPEPEPEPEPEPAPQPQSQLDAMAPADRQRLLGDMGVNFAQRATGLDFSQPQPQPQLQPAQPPGPDAFEPVGLPGDVGYAPPGTPDETARRELGKTEGDWHRRLPPFAQLEYLAGTAAGIAAGAPGAAKEAFDLTSRMVANLTPFYEHGKWHSTSKDLASKQMLKEAGKETTQYKKLSAEISEIWGMLSQQGLGFLGLGARLPIEEGFEGGKGMLEGPAAMINAYTQNPSNMGQRYLLSTIMTALPLTKSFGSGIRAAALRSQVPKFLQSSALEFANVVDPGKAGQPRPVLSRLEIRRQERIRRLEIAEGVDGIKKALDEGTISKSLAETLIKEIADDPQYVSIDGPQFFSGTRAQKIGRALRGSLWGTIILGDYLGLAPATIAGLLSKPVAKAGGKAVVKAIGLVGAKAVTARFIDGKALERLLVDPAEGARAAESIIDDPRSVGPRVTAAGQAMARDLPDLALGEIGGQVREVKGAGKPKVMPGRAIRFEIGSEGLQIADAAVQKIGDFELNVISNVDGAAWNKTRRKIEVRNAQNMQSQFVREQKAKQKAKPTEQQAIELRDPEMGPPPAKVNPKRIGNTSSRYLAQQSNNAKSYVRIHRSKTSEAKKSAKLRDLGLRMHRQRKAVVDRYMRAGLTRTQAEALLKKYDTIASTDASLLANAERMKISPSTAAEIARESGLEATYNMVEKEFAHPELRRNIAEMAADLRSLGITEPQLQTMFADAFTDVSQTRLLNAPFRGEVTRLLTNSAIEAFKASGQVLTRSSLIQNIADTYRAYGLDPSKISAKIAQTPLGEKTVARFLKKMFDDVIRERVNESTVKGTPAGIEFTLPDGRKVSTVEMSAKAWNEGGWSPEQKTKWARGSVRDLTTHLANKAERELSAANLATEAARGMETTPPNIKGQPLENLTQSTVIKALSYPAANETIPQMITVPSGAPFVETLNAYAANPELALNRVVDRSKQLAPNMDPSSITSASVGRGVGVLRRYVKADPIIKKTLDANPTFVGKDVYVDPIYNNTVSTHLNWMNSVNSTSNMARIFRWSKKALTALSVKTGFNNIMSNMLLQSTMLGKNPASIITGYTDTLKFANQFEKGLLGPREAAVGKAIYQTGIADSSILSNMYEAGFSKNPVDGRAAQFVRNTEKVAGNIYQMGDAVPKMYITRMVFDQLHQALSKLEAGREVALLPGKKKAYVLKRLADGEFEVRVPGQRSQKIGYESQAMFDLVAETAARNAKETLFDFRDVPNYLKNLSGLAGPMSSVSLFLTWAHKAMEIPGKSGILTSAVGFEPLANIRTNSPTLGAQRAAGLSKLGIKRSVLLGQAQYYASKNATKEMMGVGGYPNEAASYTPGPKEDTALKTAVSSGNPWSMVDAQLRISDATASFVAEQLGKLTGKDLVSEAVRTPPQKRTRLQKKLLSTKARTLSGKLDWGRDAALIMGLSQPMWEDIKKATDRNDYVGAAERVGALFAGTTISGLTRAAYETIARDSRFMYSKRVGADAREESLPRYFINRLIGVWAREVDTRREAEQFLERLKKVRYQPSRDYIDTKKIIDAGGALTKEQEAAFNQEELKKEEWKEIKDWSYDYYQKYFESQYGALNLKLKKMRERSEQPLFSRQ